MKKKLLSVILSIGLTVGALAGCGSTGAESSGTASENAGSEGNATEAVNLDSLPADIHDGPVAGSPDFYPNTDLSSPYTVNIYLVGDTPQDWNKIQDAVNEYLKPYNTDINATFMSWADVATMYSLTLAGGEQVDLIFTAPWEYMFTEAAKGSFYTMDKDFIAKYMPLSNKYQAPESWDETTVDGKIIAVPQNRLAPEGKIVGIRSDLAEKYGITELNNWEDFRKYLDVIAENETPESGIYANGASTNNTSFWELWYQQYDWLDAYLSGNIRLSYQYKGGLPEAEEIKLAWATDEFREFCKEMKELADEGAWSRSALNETVTQAQAFGALQGASIEWNLTVFSYMEQAEKTSGVECAAYDLTVQKGNIVPAEAYSNADMAIAAGSGNPERAAMVLDLLKNDTYLNHMIYLGIEGEHYTINENNEYTELEASANYPADSNSLSWAIRNGDLSEAGVPEREQKIIDSWQERVVSNPTTAFIFNEEPVKANMQAVDAIFGDYYGMLTLGLVDDVDATIDEMLKKADDAGMQEIMDEFYSQYNAWKASR